jgi:protein-tyrosine phosphatase
MNARLLPIIFLACALTACANEIESRESSDRDARASEDSEAVVALQPVVDGEGTIYGEEVDFSVTGPCEPGWRVLSDEVVNARDLGGVPLQDGATVPCGTLYRGAAIVSLSERGCAEFAWRGIRTVIDLRVPDESLPYPYADCVVDRARIISAPMPIPTYVSPEDYLTDLYAIDSVAAAFEAIGDDSAYPIYFNCRYGRDRTGILAAVILLALGATRDDVIAEYERTREAGLSTSPNSLEAVLDEIERLGGIDAYLALVGISSEQIAVLRARAITQ